MSIIGRLSRTSVLARNVSFVSHVLRERKRVERAVRSMPKPVPWDWAKRRLFPLLSGPCFDDPETPLVRTTAGPGCAIEFGLDIGGPFLAVDKRVAERWECSTDQLLSVATANLRRRTGRMTPSDLGTGVFSGRPVRMYRGPRVAASLVLVPDELTRLFGDHDQVLGVPSQSFLISFPIETPARVVADTLVDLETGEPLPLLYEPFILSGGKLLWQPALDEDE